MAVKRRTYTEPSGHVTTHRIVGGRGGRDAASGASLGETAPSADLGGSSKYSNENFEGRSR